MHPLLLSIILIAQTPDATMTFEVEKPFINIVAVLGCPENIEKISQSYDYNYKSIETIDNALVYKATKIKKIDAHEFKTEIYLSELGILEANKLTVIEELISPDKHISNYRTELVLEKIDNKRSKITIKLWLSYYKKSLFLKLARRVGLAQTQHAILNVLTPSSSEG